MTTAEIMAHINEVKEWHNRYGDYQGVKVDPLLAAIETLLAREADFGKSLAYAQALEAERDEWKRRLDAVVAIVGLEQQGEFEDWPAGEHIRALRDVRAIAEGRDNG